MNEAFAFGDLVVTRQGPPVVGLIAELRRTDCRVQYLREGGSVWSDLRELRRATPAEVEGSFEKEVGDLLRLLAAVELELTVPEPGRCRLLASHGALLPATVDRLRSMLGTRLRAFVIRPQGMHRIQSVIEFMIVDPAGATE
jgi:hypothetical protein